jgi:hypothetical protein
MAVFFLLSPFWCFFRSHYVGAIEASRVVAAARLRIEHETVSAVRLDCNEMLAPLR